MSVTTIGSSASTTRTMPVASGSAALEGSSARAKRSYSPGTRSTKRKVAFPEASVSAAPARSPSISKATCAPSTPPKVPRSLPPTTFATREKGSPTLASSSTMWTSSTRGGSETPIRAVTARATPANARSLGPACTTAGYRPVRRANLGDCPHVRSPRRHTGAESSRGGRDGAESGFAADPVGRGRPLVRVRRARPPLPRRGDGQGGLPPVPPRGGRGRVLPVARGPVPPGEARRGSGEARGLRVGRARLPARGGRGAGSPRSDRNPVPAGRLGDRRRDPPGDDRRLRGDREAARIPPGVPGGRGGGGREPASPVHPHAPRGRVGRLGAGLRSLGPHQGGAPPSRGDPPPREGGEGSVRRGGGPDRAVNRRIAPVLVALLVA